MIPPSYNGPGDDINKVPDCSWLRANDCSRREYVEKSTYLRICNFPERSMCIPWPWIPGYGPYSVVVDFRENSQHWGPLEVLGNILQSQLTVDTNLNLKYQA